MGILDKLFGEKGERERKLGQKPSRLSNFAHKLLSLDIKESDTAIVHALDLSKQGKTEGLKALEEAISYMHGKEDIEFYSPGLAMYDYSELDDAPKEIIELAKKNALWTTAPHTIQKLLIRTQTGGIELQRLRAQIKHLCCNSEQIRAIQLLGLHLACQSVLIKINRGEIKAMIRKIPFILYVVTDVSVSDTAQLSNSLIDRFEIEIGPETIGLVRCNIRVARLPNAEIAYFMSVALSIAREKGWEDDKLDINEMEIHKFSVDTPEKVSGYVMTV